MEPRLCRGRIHVDTDVDIDVDVSFISYSTSSEVWTGTPKSLTQSFYYYINYKSTTNYIALKFED
jgi:hypothetical protein